MMSISRNAFKLVNKLSNVVQNKANRVYALYENYFGIKELKDVQLSVLNAEKVFIDSSKARRDAQASMIKLQEELKRLRQKLDSTNRADENYLNLLTEEHKLIKNEVYLIDALRKSEEEEREKFTYFSNRLRESQDFEKIRQEKLKYISLIGSVIGALLGIIATSINHSIRKKDLNNLSKSLERQIEQDKAIDFYTIELKKIVDDLESKLDGTQIKADDKIFNELKLMNDRLSTIKNSSDFSMVESNTTEKRIFQILYTGIVVFFCYNLLFNK